LLYILPTGLEDYASPIIDAIDPSRKFFADRIYREGTIRTEYYQCVKDMARLNRDLRRTVLVDDTPLAFLHQPDNGVPILGFRGDPDDRLLLEAVLPLLQVSLMHLTYVIHPVYSIPWMLLRTSAAVFCSIYTPHMYANQEHLAFHVLHVNEYMLQPLYAE
jgi:RNA polymerase II subunit A small phosphatase-like protein